MKYENIFSKETLANLNKQSADNLKKMIGDKTLQQTIISSTKLVIEITKIEKPYRDMLEVLAQDMVENLYPIIDQEGIIIDAKIVEMSEVNTSLDEVNIVTPGIDPHLFPKDSSYDKGENVKTTLYNLIKKYPNRSFQVYANLLYPDNPHYLNSGGRYIQKLLFDLISDNLVDRRIIKNSRSKRDVYVYYVTKDLNEEINPESRRRIINGITQGAALKGAFSFYMFKEYIDDISEELVDKYGELLKNSFGIYDDENAIAMMLSLLAQGHKMGGGSSKVIINEAEETGKITIKARAICFPMLVHEIIKGLYELVSLQGFTGNKEQNQQVVDKIDTLSNEPYDIKYGKFIYEALNDILADSKYNDPKIREYFFTDVYKLSDNEFISFIENAINKKLTSYQAKWIDDTLRSISLDLRDDEFDKMDL